jgi:putative hydrolase of the HAD superfamily
MTAFPASVEAWVFDLDNTLYPASCRLFHQVDRRIGQYIASRLNMGPEEARALQKHYFRTYGTTLRGLMDEHKVEPQGFLDFVHEIDVGVIPPDPQLGALLDAAPGRKFVYTNGSAGHAANVLRRLGIADRFSGVFDIVDAGYTPKPDPRPYGAMTARFGVDPTRACMVEDIARNLKPAKDMGMATVWVRTDSDFARPAVEDLTAVDHVADGLNEWLADALAGRLG